MSLTSVVGGTGRLSGAVAELVRDGKGHDVAYWTEFLRALHEVDPEMLVNIEHEDTELGRVEGVAAAEVLKAADAALRESLAG
jgi:sugar phosphate isomerase/epimerase